MPLWMQLFCVFLKIGLFTFGGGYAMLGIITENCVEKKKWITHGEMMDITVIAETTPGPIAINCATFVGWRQAGLWGAVCATIGVVMPSFLIIYAISLFLEGFMGAAVVANAFRGIQITVGFLIVQAGLKLSKQLDRRRISTVILFGAFGLTLAADVFGLPLSTISLMVGGALVGLALTGLKKGGVGK